MRIAYSYVPAVTLHTERLLQRFGGHSIKQRRLLRAYQRSQRNMPVPATSLQVWQCQKCGEKRTVSGVKYGCVINLHCKKCKDTTEHA
jgi:predicted ABC-type ATPase